MKFEKNTIIAVVLSVAVIFVYQAFLAPKPTTTPVKTAQQENKTEVEHGGNIEQIKPLAPLPLTPANKPVGEAIVQPLEEYDIHFDSTTGDIRAVALKSYTDANNEVFTFNRDGKRNYAVINTPIADGFVMSYDEAGEAVTFTAENEQLIVAKRYHLNETNNKIPVDIMVTNKTAQPLTIPLSVAIGPDLGKGIGDNKYIYEGPIIRNNEKTITKKAKDVKETLTLQDPLWGGYTSKYFLFSAFADSFDKIEIVKDGNSALVQMDRYLVVPAGETVSTPDFGYFIGPKNYENLKSFGIDMQKSVDYGWFAVLAIPMAKFLNFIYGFVGNYGIAIILLTLVIKIITLPLTMKSMISMKAMSKLQPEVMALKEKFKDEPQKLNVATMELYKKNNVNPMSGCLPMVIQIPIFFALYKALMVSYELKGAPFFFHIADLSIKDPYYILPVLMGISMFVQQKMTPTTADPMQQKIFLAMPVIFTFLFLNFPSGLVIYWLTNNLLSIAQQYVINKKMK